MDSNPEAKLTMYPDPRRLAPHKKKPEAKAEYEKYFNRKEIEIESMQRCFFIFFLFFFRGWDWVLEDEYEMDSGNDWIY